jgi:hypothetical protein
MTDQQPDQSTGLFSIVAYYTIGKSATSQGLALVFEEPLAREIAHWRSTQFPAITYQVFNATSLDLVTSFKNGMESPK